MKTLGFMAAILTAGALLLTLWGAILVAVTRPGMDNARASEVPFFFSAGAFGTIMVMGALVVVLRRIDKT
jgi:hypothetical protein